MISKMFISFSFSKCDIKTHINKGYTKVTRDQFFLKILDNQIGDGFKKIMK